MDKCRTTKASSPRTERVASASSPASLSRLLHLGVRDDMAPDHTQLVVTANGALLANGLAAGLAAVAAGFLGHPKLGWILFLVPVCMVVGLVLSAAGRTVASRAWLTTSQCGVVVLLAWVGGTELVQAVPFLLLTVAFMVFTGRERIGLWTSVGFVVAAAIPIYWPGILPPVTTEFSTDETHVLASVIGLLVFVSVLSILFLNHRARDAAVTELTAARHRAEVADRAKSAFLATMSHEIRTPLGAILGHAALLGDPRTTEAERAEALRALARNGDHLFELVNRVLDFSKIEAGELLLELEPVSIARIVADVDSIMRVKAREKGIAFEPVFATKIPARITSDSLRIRQILLNLLGNAMKFTEEGRVELRVGYDGEAQVLRLSVIDTGPGIPLHELERVLEPFSQAEDTARTGEGTGLGLPISTRLAELLGGRLELTSIVGQGTEATLSLPVSVADASELITPSLTGGRAAPATRNVNLLEGRRILLAEDFADSASLILFHLRHAGATAVWVANGELALREVAEAEANSAPFDVILMDNQMPILDGLSAIRTLRSRGCRVRVLSLTAHSMAGDRELCLAAGADGYLTKPVDFPALFGEIRRLSSPPSPGIPPARTAHPAANPPALEAQLREIAAEFATTLPAHVANLRTLIANDDDGAATDLAHRLAGSAGMYGYHSFGEAARRLELLLCQAERDPEALQQRFDAMDLALPEGGGSGQTGAA